MNANFEQLNNAAIIFAVRHGVITTLVVKHGDI